MNKKVTRDTVGVAIVVVSSLCIAFVPSSAKISINEGASIIALLISRCLIGALLLFPITLMQRTRLLISRALLARIIIATIFNVGMIGCLYSAVQFVDVGLAVLLPLGQDITLPQTMTGWIAILSNSTFYMLGFWLFFEGCRIIGVTRASILTLVDPLFAAIIAILFLGQFLTFFEWIGFAIILGALLVFETQKSKETRSL